MGAYNTNAYWILYDILKCFKMLYLFCSIQWQNTRLNCDYECENESSEGVIEDWRACGVLGKRVGSDCSQETAAHQLQSDCSHPLPPGSNVTLQKQKQNWRTLRSLCCQISMESMGLPLVSSIWDVYDDMSNYWVDPAVVSHLKS